MSDEPVIDTERQGQTFVTIVPPEIPGRRKPWVAQHPQNQLAYDKGIGDLICNMVAAGATVAEVSLMPDMPSYTTINHWRHKVPEFGAQVEEAIRQGTHFLMDECLEIADGDGDPTNKRIRIDTRMRLAAKRNAKQYGDKVEVNNRVSGAIAHVNMDMTPKEAAEQWQAQLEAQQNNG